MRIAGTTVLASGEEFTPPGPADFNLPPIFGGDATFSMFGQEFYYGVTKPMLQIVVAGVLVFVFFRLAIAKRSMVPGRMQFAGEQAYGFVRNSLGRDIIGGHDFIKYVPYLFALFFFILVNNFMASVPFIQFPTFSRSGMVYGLALLSWIIYNVAGMRVHGVAGLLQAPVRPARHHRPHADPAGAARVHVEHPRAADHAGPATLRQHVRRPPAADPVRPGR